jgi:hypothetical protein
LRAVLPRPCSSSLFRSTGLVGSTAPGKTSARLLSKSRKALAERSSLARMDPVEAKQVATGLARWTRLPEARRAADATTAGQPLEQPLTVS